ncbi:MAG: glycoside hydrolase family 13 protein [Oscillospiraceae bacterium]|nr:glycoside hydrolase family 13 protein [Oscillospiraceae bacterium]
MDAVICRGRSPSGEETLKRMILYFGGSYREHWSEDYTLAVHYEGRTSVDAVCKDGVWRAVGGDGEWVRLLNSPECPAVTMLYFQGAASVYAAARECAARGLPLDRLDECFYSPSNPFTAPELVRLLMDDCGFSMRRAFQVAAACCGDLRCSGVDAAQVYPLQPRTAHIINILRSTSASSLAARHNSTDSFYRSPLGAQPEGAVLTLRLKVLAGKAIRADLLLYGDGFRREIPMIPAEKGFAVTFRLPEKAQALWYCFRLLTPDGTHWLCADASGYHGRLCTGEEQGFRLTVYKKDFETPAWFRRSVMYQIFPDRFAFSTDGTAEAGVRYHRALGQQAELHQSLDEPPRWQPRPFERSYTPDDFYGGTLKGIREKLPYLKKLGIGCLYLNPIGEARSNHRYDTSDYLKVDPILGSNEDLTELCEAARDLGIRVMLDGVYSHTGDDSVYFNRYGHYSGKGACQGKDSPYYPWYDFKHFPDKYRCWWGFDSLPEVEETNSAWQDFVITGPNSVVRSWLRRGTSAWRLDVADELPDQVLSLIRKAAKEEKPDAVVLGEVWEDAVLKESYGSRRNYALGYSLDSVMNYPLRIAILDFAHHRSSAYQLRDFLITQQHNYPLPLYYSLMNLLGSHDVERLRSALATDIWIKTLSREEQLKLDFSEEALEQAVELEKLCAVLQFSLPGVPSIYYGDEQGMCGVGDPFNRLPFREERQDLFEHYAALSALRNGSPALSTGHARFLALSRDLLLVLRWIADGRDIFGEPAENGVYLAVLNRSREASDYELDCSALGCGLVRGSIKGCCGEIRRLL